MENNIELNFDAEISAKDAKKNLRVPIVNLKNKSITNELTKNKSQLSSLVKVEDLVIDMSYQREPNTKKVSLIARTYNPDAIGVLICSAREDGTIAVIDGGHRVAAMHMLNLSHETVDCLIYFGLSIEEEAKIFHLMNDNRTKPKTQDLFKSKVAAGDIDALTVKAILDQNGLVVGNAPGMNIVRAIGTLMDLYKKTDSKNIGNVLNILSHAFDKHSTSFNDASLIATSMILNVYENSINIDRLTKAINSFGISTYWVNSGSIISKNMGYKMTAKGMAHAAINEYNKNLRSNRLDIGKLV